MFENSERRQKEEPLEVQISMENTESNGLGISLPGGKVEMYTYKKSSGLEYIGADNMGQVPKRAIDHSHTQVGHLMSSETGRF